MRAAGARLMRPKLAASYIQWRQDWWATEQERLQAAHAERVGERILSWIDERFPTIGPKVPLPSAGIPSVAALRSLPLSFRLTGRAETYLEVAKRRSRM